MVTPEDLEMLAAAYPDEMRIVSSSPPQEDEVPSIITLILPDDGDGDGDDDDGRIDNFIELEVVAAIDPRGSGGGNGGCGLASIKAPVRVRSFRHRSRVAKSRMERTVRAVRDAVAAHETNDDDDDQTVGMLLFRICHVTLDTWHEEGPRQHHHPDHEDKERVEPSPPHACDKEDHGDEWDETEWNTGDILTDRKSTFQAHLAVIDREDMVAAALEKLITSSTKLQRATHNMYAYRVVRK